MAKDTRLGALEQNDSAGLARRRMPRRATGLAFPCGHQESEASVLGRMREREHALWITCRRCNVLVIVVTGG